MASLRGAYPADRAAALSGVPKSTVHYWARKEILVPSISAERIKLWSYPDLMGLRVIYWLRQGVEGSDVPRATMPAVRNALEALRALDVDLWNEQRGSGIAVDRGGGLVLDPEGLPVVASSRQMAAAELLDLTHPFPTSEGTRGPDLRKPRPHLRIIPGKLAGAPHVQRSRVDTEALAALARRGMKQTGIAQLYPVLDSAGIADALDLEDQLAENLAA